jgi:hypothetical protein
MSAPVVAPVAGGGAPGRVARLARRRGIRAAAATVATSAAGLVGVEFLVLSVWGADTHSAASPGTVLRIGADLWLLAHGTTLRLPGGSVDLLPLGLAVLPLVLAASAGRRRAGGRAGVPGGVPAGTPVGAAAPAAEPAGPRRDGSGRGPTAGGREAAAIVRLLRFARSVVWDVFAVAAVQATFVCVVAVLVSDPAVRPRLVSAVVGAFALTAVGAAVGVLAGHARAGTTCRLVRGPLRIPVVAAGGAAATALVAVAALGVAVVLAATSPEIASATRELGPGPVDGVGLAAVQVALLPNFVIWGLCYALGPGFATGGDGLVRPSGVRAADLPELPVLRALPPDALPRPAWLVLALVPLVAGGVLAASVRRATPGGSLRRRLWGVVAGAVVCGLLVGGLAELSGGALGSVRTSPLGPDAGWALLAAAGEVGACAALITCIGQLVVRGAVDPFVPADLRTASLRRRLQVSNSWLAPPSRRQN